MAKKDKKKKKDKTSSGAADAVRSAVERTFQATAEGAQSTRVRARDLVDEVAGATQRVREVIDDLRVLDDLKGLRAEIEALSRRVGALELRDGAGAAPERAAPARRSSTRRSTGTAAARKPVARTPAARTPAPKKPTAASKGSTRSTPRRSGGSGTTRRSGTSGSSS
jgi:hypothetical protein